MNDHDERKNDEEKRKLTEIKKERENRDVHIITSTIADLFDSQNKYMYPQQQRSLAEYFVNYRKINVII